MQSLLSDLESKKCWKSFLKTQCRKNSVYPEVAGSFTIVKIKRFFEKLNTIDISNRPRMKSSCWLENELKAYHWVLIAMSGIKDVLVQKFKQDQWKELGEIFNKEETILQYQAIKLVNQKQNKKKWDYEETQILMKIVGQDTNNNKWNQIARKLFEVSGKKYFRSGKQCRERWLNHLDPNKKHGEWSEQQDQNIVKFISDKGKKWSEISKLLGNQRTQHMVKNRFKTIIIKQKKIYPECKNQMELLNKYAPMDTNFSVSQLQNMKIDKIQEENQNKQESYDLQIGDNLGVLNQKIVHTTTTTSNTYDFQQVHTPCPILYQCFTPNFLHSPHPLPFFMTNCSFDQLEKRENLFLKENN